jgi:hypothetical protein
VRDSAYVYVYVYVHVHAHVHAHVYVYVYVYVCLCACAWTLTGRTVYFKRSIQATFWASILRYKKLSFSGCFHENPSTSICGLVPTTKVLLIDLFWPLR